MAALPYMQFYVAEYLADTMHLTAEEHGAYMLLMLNYWQTGKPIPKSRLARIAKISNDRWTTVEASLKEFFIDLGSEWMHKRIEADLEVAREAHEQRSLAGKASAEARKRRKTAELKREISARSTTVATTVDNSLEQDGNEKPTNKSRVDESREDNKNTTPHSPPTGGSDNAEPDKPAPTKPAKRKTKLPADFELTDHRTKLAVNYWASVNRWDLDVEKEFFKFVNNHKARGTTMADWDAAWQTWYCNSVEFNKPPGGFPYATGQRPAPASAEVTRTDTSWAENLDPNNDEL